MVIRPLQSHKGSPDIGRIVHGGDAGQELANAIDAFFVGEPSIIWHMLGRNHSRTGYSSGSSVIFKFAEHLPVIPRTQNASGLHLPLLCPRVLNRYSY